jgi:hypothetical protein
MRCIDAAKYVSVLHDGGKIPREAAEHLGTCEECAERLAAYSTIGAELRRAASLAEPLEVPNREWEVQARPRSSGWGMVRQSMRIPRFAFALMVAIILLLSGGLLVRAKPNETGSVLWLAVKLPPDGKVFHVAVATDGEPNSDGFGNFGIVPTGGILSMNARFLRREGQRVEFAVKTRYENPDPKASGPAEDRLKDVAEQDVWVEPDKNSDVMVTGLGTMQFAGVFIDHKPPAFFSPEDTIDPKANEFRFVSPVLIRDKQVVFNERGASSSGDNSSGSGVFVYWPGEGRFLFSPAPFKDAVEGSVFESQVTFKLNGEEYTLLTAVPVTRQSHIWIKHEPNYRRTGHDTPSLGGGDKQDFPTD